MSTIGDMITQRLRSKSRAASYEDFIAALLKTSNSARRQVLMDLRDSSHPTDMKLYDAVLELSKAEGEIASLTYNIQILENEPRVEDLIQEMYGR